jgi:hypothetical protein
MGSDGKSVNLKLAAYILPRKEQFDSREFFRAGLIRRWNASQGIYVYRVDRLVKTGGWFRLRGSDEHCKLSRISLDVDRNADAALNLNIQKSTITLPSVLKLEVNTWVRGCAQRARIVYDGKSSRQQTKKKKKRPTKTNSGTDVQKGNKKPSPPPSKMNEKYKDVLTTLWASCDTDYDRGALKRISKKAYPNFNFAK